ncbi:tRNA-specific adenosine deaminase 1 [Apophysomyces ossiformis]|uniref:tRNA-specific adenosine deaminase 1 n=1 Tax=Apophysomyces ossiformis TaxID=679940 RepID=A0A8H7EQI6_9FUNG|nr:tRNA-specific adenosine deaminase 1 [Apophysomyces ossiformis]
MSSVVNSHIFKDIFGTAQMRDLWSDEARTGFYLEWEVALANAQAKLGIIPAEARDEIVNKAKIENIDFDKLKQKTELIGYPVLGVVQQIVGLCRDGLGEWVHWGATTQDVTDSATVLAIRASLDVIEADLEHIMASVARLAEEHRLTPMAARSNLQQAVPISFGFKMARLLATLQRHKERLGELRKRVLTVEFSGAAGTLATLDANVALECQAGLARELGLAQPEIAWHTERDRIAEVGAFLGILCGTLSKNATDIKLMMQTEVGEVSEPYVPHRGSSSTMPNKFNPISCVYIHALAATVRQQSAALMDAMVEDHERSTGPWEIEWIVLPEAFVLTAGALNQTKTLMAGLQVHPERMAQNLALTKGLIVSEAVMMGLGPKLGRQTAHDLVYDYCRRALKEDRMLVDLLKEDKEITAVLSDEALESLCDPANYLGLSGPMVDIVLQKYKQERHKA